jgi:hypothetical protein
MYEVSGTVTYNNVPLPDGKIVMEPVDGRTVPGASSIVNGAFKLKVPAGKKVVKIFAERDAGFDPAMGTKMRFMYIPAKYNHDSTLEADVTKAGPNQFTFPLTER